MAVSLAVCTCALIIAKSMELTELVVTRQLGLDVVGRLIFYTIPYLLVFAVPISTLLAVVLAFLRLTQDNELTALKSAGIGLGKLLPTVGGLALAAGAVTFWLTMSVLPWSHHQFENLVYSVSTSRADLALKEKQFVQLSDSIMIYVAGLPSPKSLLDVFIADERDSSRKQTIVAKRGRLFVSPQGRLILRLYDGTIHWVGQTRKEAGITNFETYDLTAAVMAAPARRSGDKHRKEMSYDELSAKLDSAKPGSRDQSLLQMEMQQRFAYPIACLVMALIGVPLGSHWRAGRSWGVVIAMGVFLFYYMLMSLAWSLVETGIYPPLLGVWVPNLVIGALGVMLLRREMQEMPFWFLDETGHNFKKLYAILTRRT
jgi:lipopolysaccharide export system permease protein